jgi:putative FmdB family regulatory protein
MPSYDYRCKSCGRPSTFTYKTYADYDAAAGARICPHCGSAELTRLISRVAFARPSRDYSSMDSQEMLSVLEGGKPEEMGAMFQQVADTVPDGMDSQYHEVAERLLKGEKPENIESDLQSANPASTPDAPDAD